MIKYTHRKDVIHIKSFEKIIFSLFILAFIIPITTFFHFYTKMNSLFNYDNEVKAESQTSLIEINDAIISDNITNILLIGTDARDTSERGRSDAMMIVTIDEKHRSIKITSLARDTYVDIPGHGEQKLNHSYSYGGADLLIKTIKHNFHLDISNYAILNFNSFASVIDALGGVTVDVKKSEINELNKYIPECFEASNKKKNNTFKLIENAGIQKLNGYQALSYSRIRKNDSATERDNRQRKVMQSLMNEASDISIFEIPKVLNAVLPHIKTNMNFNDILQYSKKVLKMGNFEINQLAFPIEGYKEDKRLKNKGWVTIFDKQNSLPLLHQFIFEDEEFLKQNKVYNSFFNKNTTSNDNATQEENIENKKNNTNEDSILDNSHLNSNLKPEDFFNNNYYNNNDILKELENADTENVPYS